MILIMPPFPVEGDLGEDGGEVPEPVDLGDLELELGEGELVVDRPSVDPVLFRHGNLSLYQTHKELENRPTGERPNKWDESE